MHPVAVVASACLWGSMAVADHDPVSSPSPAATGSTRDASEDGAGDSTRGGLAIGAAPLHAVFLAGHLKIDGEPPAAERMPSFGAADSLRVNLVGGIVSNLSSTTGATARVEFEYFMAERFSIVPVAELGWLGQDDADDAFMAGGAVLLRWHLLENRRWTVFADAGVGLAYLTADLPPATNRIKFSPQVGVGFTLAIEDDPAAARLMGGVRWYHLSNARTAETNDGFDGVMAYLGVTLPF